MGTVEGPPISLPITSPKFHRVKLTLPHTSLIPPGTSPTSDDALVDEGSDPEFPGLGIYWHSSALDMFSINLAPDNPAFIERGWLFWPSRKITDIDGISIHHSGGSWSLKAVADYHTNPYDGGESGKGYPWVQYHWWVMESYPYDVILCTPLTWATWHDHTSIDGINCRIAICLQGKWNDETPLDGQIASTVKLCSWLMWKYDISIQQVLGHTERAGNNEEGELVTVCPGWTGTWKDRFYDELQTEKARMGL